MYTHKNTGTCSVAIHLDINDEGKITFCEFERGCAGNTAGIAKLVIGCDAEEVANRLQGTKCGPRATSCPDQLAHAIRECLAAKKGASTVG